MNVLCIFSHVTFLVLVLICADNLYIVPLYILSVDNSTVTLAIHGMYVLLPNETTKLNSYIRQLTGNDECDGMRK